MLFEGRVYLEILMTILTKFSNPRAGGLRYPFHQDMQNLNLFIQLQIVEACGLWFTDFGFIIRCSCGVAYLHEVFVHIEVAESGQLT